MADDDVSRVVALAWGVAASPQRGPKRELSHERIVEKAMEIADAEGLSAVTMARVAQSFGFTTMAIYRYVAAKEDLHRLMLDGAFADRPTPDVGGGWRAGLEAWADWLLAGYRAHPWVLEIPMSMEALMMPSQMTIADAALRAMADLPATQGERLALLVALSTSLRGMAAMEQEITGPQAEVSQATKDLVREVVEGVHLPALAPLVASGAYFGEGDDGSGGELLEDEFTRGLEVWLAGVETLFASRSDVPEAQCAAPAPPETPAQQLARAEAELAAAVAARKEAEARVKELYRAEAAARKRRDRAKEVAKAAAKLEQG
ncbi:TetR/AcrR family transcriptional regulator [Tessaracoccus terricola]